MAVALGFQQRSQESSPGITMGPRVCAFRQADVRRAVQAVLQAGIEIARVEIDREGKIIIVSVGPNTSQTTELDEWMKHHADAVERH
jgi:hypothetical protein